MYKRQAQDVLRGFQEAEETLGQGRPLALRVGANVSFGEAGLAQVLGRFRQEHPQVRLRALVANSDKIQSLLAENQLDVGIVDGLGVSERLRAQPLYQEDLVLAAAPGRFPAPATVEELAALPLLLREPGSGLRSSVDRVFSQQGLAPQPLLESTSTAALAQAAKAGLGVAILPEALAQRESGLQVGTCLLYTSHLPGFLGGGHGLLGNALLGEQVGARQGGGNRHADDKQHRRGPQDFLPTKLHPGRLPSSPWGPAESQRPGA